MVKHIVKEVIRTPLWALFVFIVTAISLLFNVPLLIAPFVISLYHIMIHTESEYAQFRNVIGGHLIGFGVAFFEPAIRASLSFFPGPVLEAALIAVMILLAGWIMSVTRFKHPEALATTLMFVEVEKVGPLLFGAVPMQAVIPFFVGLIIVGIAAYRFNRKR